ncbi:MAG: histidine--tRNA ligase [Endomicrobiia bacterium]|nr:histidine--tRNA ligase [Endomicrobiia bacterium]
MGIKYRLLRGMRDISGAEAEKISRVVESAKKTFRAFNYSELMLPTMEEAALFARAAGETSDVVAKQMYVFKDKGDRTVALRPEGTAGAARYYVESGAAANSPIVKIFYSGSMFRYERPQEGRYREFYQIGCEYFGNSDAACDAEIIHLASMILDEAGVREREIFINTLGCPACRRSYADAVKKYAASLSGELCEDCLRRIEKNPLRVLDCKTDAEKLSDFPRSQDALCPECLKHYSEVKKLLDAIGVKYTEDFRLVRGLDYYTRTVFEIKSRLLGAQDAVAAGGRYDGLVEELFGRPTPAAGFAVGVERMLMASAGQKEKYDGGFFVAVTSPAITSAASKLAAEMRAAGIRTEGPLASKSLKSQLGAADKMGFGQVVIIADEELAYGDVIIKNMGSGEQKKMKLSGLVGQLAEQNAKARDMYDMARHGAQAEQEKK